MRTGQLVLTALALAGLTALWRTHATFAQTPTAPQPAQYNVEEAIQAARQTVKLFSERITGELTAAIKADGAANAVALCQTISPDIPTKLSDETGFEVIRTSLRLRNPENAAGPWELNVLKKFEERVTAGEDPARLEHHEIVTTPEGDRLFRYMKSIRTGELCLTCHGTAISPDVKAELERYYPDDKATGYRLGELRGAFSLVKLLGQ